ncbi:MAG: DUF91 domain-containing protein [Phycisphaerae bacterium]|nr:DUF91 domain-containing protein [Phycisphaerae bacterium]
MQVDASTPAKNYYRVMLRSGSAHEEECFTGNFIGTDDEIEQDLADRLHQRWQDFHREFIPIYLRAVPGKTRIGAGLTMGALWTVSKGISRGDVILCPDGSGNYRVGEVTGNYYYVRDGTLMHRRPVRWFERIILRSEMSPALRGSVSTPVTAVWLNKHTAEIDWLHRDAPSSESLGSAVAASGETEVVQSIEDPAAFALEKHLEDFLIRNWAKTELGREYDIFEDEGQFFGQQYLTDTGPIDILAVSKNKRRLLVVELKKGRASDAVVGQVLRSMGYVKEELAEDGQEVRWVIIAREDETRLRQALSVTPAIDLYRYRVDFALHRA